MRSAARLVALLGAIGLGYVLFSASPRDLVLVYDLGGERGASSLEVEIRRDADVVRRAHLAAPPGGGQVRHPVRLPDGEYVLQWRLVGGEGAARSGERPLEVREDGTVVLALGR
jgi:hypothetical protein